MKTIVDMAIELNQRYSQMIKKISEKRDFEKGERSRIFNDIIRDLFNKYHEELGYENTLASLSDFMSILVRGQKSLKKSTLKEETFKTEMSEDISEGSGVIFVLNQIVEFDLNPDSY